MGNVNYYKSVHQPIPTREYREHPGNFQNKSVSSAFNWVLPFYFLKWNRFFTACKRKFLESKSQFYFEFCMSSVPSSITPLNFLAQILYSLLKSSPLTCRFLKFSSAQVKTCQISHDNLELTSQFIFNFCIIARCHDTKLPCKF